MTPKQRLRKYIEWRKQARGIDREHIHGFSPGSPSEATLLLSDIEALLALAEPEQESHKPTEEVLNHAVNRFLGWKLPREFSPDNGIVFKLPRWDGFPLPEGWPIGTNLLTADQAKSMFEHCLNGAPLCASPQPREWKELSEQEYINCLLAANITESVRMTREVGPYSLTEPTAPANWLYKNVSAALRAKNGFPE